MNGRPLAPLFHATCHLRTPSVGLPFTIGKSLLIVWPAKDDLISKHRAKGPTFYGGISMRRYHLAT